MERNSKSRKRKKIIRFDKFMWKLLFLDIAVFVGVMAWTKMFPIPYLVGVGSFLIAVLMIVKIMQQRACRYYGIKRKPKGRLITFVMLAVLGISTFYLLKLNNALEEITVGEESGIYETEHTIDVATEPFNIYISGIDVYGEITTESRSDVNLIATVNSVTHRILLTTTPRDYYVTIPGVSGDYRDKLTHAGIYGIDTSVDTLENLYQTEIPFYARVNFTSVIDIIDAMGGIDVESELAFTTSKASGTVVEIQEGMNHLNGKEALAFVRERKAFLDGDHQRGKNQQALLTAMIKKAISPMILLQASDMIDSIVGNAETNMSAEQLKMLIRMQLDSLATWEVESIAATGDDSGKQYCYSYSGAPLYVCVPSTESVNEIIQKIDQYLTVE